MNAREWSDGTDGWAQIIDDWAQARVGNASDSDQLL